MDDDIKEVDEEVEPTDPDPAKKPIAEIHDDDADIVESPLDELDPEADVPLEKALAEEEDDEDDDYNEVDERDMW